MGIELVYHCGTNDYTVPKHGGFDKLNHRVLNLLDISITAFCSESKIPASRFYKCSKLTSIYFDDTSTGYKTDDKPYTNGTYISVLNSTTNATNLTTTYYKQYWYKL